jgi:hypothetical protein
MLVEFKKKIQEQIDTKQLQRDESFSALQKIEVKMAELRQRIVLLDGALMQLRELDQIENTP